MGYLCGVQGATYGVSSSISASILVVVAFNKPKPPYPRDEVTWFESFRNGS